MIFKGLYHEIRKVSPPEARSLILKLLTENNHNVSQTACILGISRDTVYRTLRGPRETPHQLQDLILSEAKRTGFRYRRLTKHLWIKFGLSLSENTIKAILKRNSLRTLHRGPTRYQTPAR